MHTPSSEAPAAAWKKIVRWLVTIDLALIRLSHQVAKWPRRTFAGLIKKWHVRQYTKMSDEELANLCQALKPSDR